MKNLLYRCTSLTALSRARFFCVVVALLLALGPQFQLFVYADGEDNKIDTSLVTALPSMAPDSALFCDNSALGSDGSGDELALSPSLCGSTLSDAMGGFDGEVLAGNPGKACKPCSLHEQQLEHYPDSRAQPPSKKFCQAFANIDSLYGDTMVHASFDVHCNVLANIKFYFVIHHNEQVMHGGLQECRNTKHCQGGDIPGFIDHPDIGTNLTGKWDAIFTGVSAVPVTREHVDVSIFNASVQCQPTNSLHPTTHMPVYSCQPLNLPPGTHH